MRRRKDARVRSSAGQVGSHGVRKSRLVSRNVAHSAQSDICGARSTTPSPVIAGIRSDKLTVRNNAMMTSQTVGGRTTQSRTPLLDCVARHQPSRRAACKTVRDRGGTFKPGTGTERGDGGTAARNQGTARSAGALDRYRFNFLDKLLERDRAAPIEELARELFGARS